MFCEYKHDTKFALIGANLLGQEVKYYVIRDNLTQEVIYTSMGKPKIIETEEFFKGETINGKYVFVIDRKMYPKITRSCVESFYGTEEISSLTEEIEDAEEEDVEEHLRYVLDIEDKTC